MLLQPMGDLAFPYGEQRMTCLYVDQYEINNISIEQEILHYKTMLEE